MSVDVLVAPARSKCVQVCVRVCKSGRKRLNRKHFAANDSILP